MKILCLLINTGEVQPLAWHRKKLSVKEYRRLFKHYKHDKDVIGISSIDFTRLGYTTKRDVKTDLEKYQPEG